MSRCCAGRSKPDLRQATVIEHLHWLIAAAVIVGLAKGGLSSVGSLAVPMLALFMNPVQAAAFLLPVLIVTDMVAVWLYRRDYSGRNVAILVPAMLCGIGIATLIVPFAPEALLLAITGGIGIWTLWRRWFGSKPETPSPARIGPGFFWGTIAGITTFITHSGAPPTQAFLLPQNLPRLTFAGTFAVSFAIANFSKLPGYYALGLFDAANLRLQALLVLTGISGTVAGRAIVKRLTDDNFTRVIELLLLILSVVLLAKAAMWLF